MAHDPVPSADGRKAAGVSWTEYAPKRETDTHGFCEDANKGEHKKRDPLKKPSDIDYFNDHFYVCDKVVPSYHLLLDLLSLTMQQGKSQIVIFAREQEGNNVEMKYILKHFIPRECLESLDSSVEKRLEKFNSPSLLAVTKTTVVNRRPVLLVLDRSVLHFFTLGGAFGKESLHRISHY